jgi:hypothetical protein
MTTEMLEEKVGKNRKEGGSCLDHNIAWCDVWKHPETWAWDVLSQVCGSIGCIGYRSLLESPSDRPSVQRWSVKLIIPCDVAVLDKGATYGVVTQSSEDSIEDNGLAWWPFVCSWLRGFDVPFAKFTPGLLMLRLRHPRASWAYYILLSSCVVFCVVFACVHYIQLM